MSRLGNNVFKSNVKGKTEEGKLCVGTALRLGFAWTLNAL